MKKIASVSILLLLIFSSLYSQNINDIARQISKTNSGPRIFSPIQYLSSDELKGRDAMAMSSDIAANYIAQQFKKHNLTVFTTALNYYQKFTLNMIKPAGSGILDVDGDIFTMPEKLVELDAKNVQITAPVIFIGYGSEADLTHFDVKGKIVVTDIGDSQTMPFMTALRYIRTKQKRLKDAGALALIERFKDSGHPWSEVQGYFSKQYLKQPGEDNLMPIFMVNDIESKLNKNIAEGRKGSISVTNTTSIIKEAKNVIGYIKGTQLELRDEYLVLSAHYDHLGISKTPEKINGKIDSIFNGARDNAVGVASLIASIDYFTKYPPKRSIIFIAYTAEEIGEIGSQYFAEHPVVPLKDIIYNLNNDNTAYNDTERATVIGIERTSSRNLIELACKQFQLKALPDDLPQQHLFERSDNYSLALKGIPAITFGMGINKFDDEIQKYYHKVNDEFISLDKNYIRKFINSYVLSAKLIADEPSRPKWISDDKSKIDKK